MVRKIEEKDRQLAIELMNKGFQGNPNIKWMSRNIASIKKLCAHCLDIAMIRDGAFISTDEKGILLAFPKKQKLSLRQRMAILFLYVKVAAIALKLVRIAEIIKQEIFLRQHQPKGNFLYCQILCTSHEARELNTTINLRNHLFQLSDELNLPIFAQTSVRRNKVLFTRYGFENYQTVKNFNAKFDLWLLKRMNYVR